MTRGRRGTTLVDVLLRAAEEAPDQVIVHVDGDGSERVVTYRELCDDASRVAAGLRTAVGRARPGRPVVLRLDRSADFQAAFWGAVLAGFVPVPLAPDPARVAAVSAALDGPFVITRDRLDSLRRAGSGEPHRPEADDLAFLQYSSGSTGDPRGVEVTHANIAANLEQATVAGGFVASDVIVSWLPFHHDLGLIGSHLVPLAARMKQVVLSPVMFAKRPERWLRTASRHRATVLPAVNFALALVVRRVPAEVLAELDLSAVRLCAVGAEPIAPAVWRSFIARTAPSRLDPAALQPVYGLAEATLGVCAPPLGEVATPVLLDRVALAAGRAVEVEAGKAVPAPARDGSGSAEFMDVGGPVPGCAVRIVDDGREPLPDRRIGHIEVRGPNVARGYHRDPAATAASFVDGWLRTGDLGFLRAGRLCVTGRAKDVVFVNGATFHASDLEAVAAATPGLPAGPCAVVGSPDPDTGADRIAVFVPRGAPVEAVAARIAAATGHSDVHVVTLSSLPRTTSGKVRRGELRARFEDGRVRGHERVLRSVTSRGEPDAAESVVRRAWGRVLGRDPAAIGADERFFEAGGTSLGAMQVLAELEDAGVGELDPVVLRDHATIAELTEVLRGKRPPHRVVGSRGGPRPGPVAVIGMACRFPGAATPEEFWDALVAGRDAVTASPRWVGSGSFIDDPAAFDAAFFDLDADEARHTDPQTRILLEVAHEALERAGYAGSRRRRQRVGIFAAAGDSGYGELVRRAVDAGRAPARAGLIGGLRNLVAARIAHALDLDGPALVVDTACSSALTALHLARLSIEAGECDLAVVGGVNLNLTADAHRALDDAQAISPTGRCRVFSADADGIVPGEGAAALVLTGADAAHRRGDPVLALVRGSAVNNDGRALSVLTPNPHRQAAVIARAYLEAGVDPARVSYVEAHGTGTVLGDPMEVRSLARSLPPRAGGGPRWLGSVKANLGHLLAAAGMPALVKVVLALQHRRLPPSPHHAPLSGRLGLDAAGLVVVDRPVEWTADSPRIAGVNGFGFGGTNVHVILEEAPRPAASVRRNGPDLLTLSAHSAAALAAAVAELRAHALARPDLSAADICASAGSAREDGLYRLAAVVDGDSAAAVAEALAMPAGEGMAKAGTPAGAAAEPDGIRGGARPRIAFVVPGERATVGAGVALARGLVAAGIRPDAVLRSGPRTGFDVVVRFDDPAALPDARSMLALAGQLWQAGLPLDRTALDAGTVRVPVPTYPFQRQRHWMDPPLRLHRPVWTPAPIVGTPPRPVVVLREEPDLDAIRRLASAVLLVTENAQLPVAAGLLLALPAEVPGLGVRVVDLSTMDSPDERAATVERERAAPPPAGAAEEVAWRGGVRLARSTEPVDHVVEESTGAYLITGGTGGLAAELARELTRADVVVLAARSPEPPGQLLAELRERGVHASYIRCDVTDPASVDALAAAVPPLDAVFHLAGVVRPGSLAAKDDAEVRATLAPKVLGTTLLADALDRHDRTPRRFVCASSIVAVRPDLSGGVADYAAANRFQAAFAAARPGRVTVHLPAVADTGMSTPALTSALSAAGAPVTDAATAARALRAALTLDGPELIAGEASMTVAAVSGRAVRAGDADAGPSTVRRLIEQHVGRELRTDESLLRQGIDSLTAVDLVKKLEHRLGRDLPTTLLFEHDTIDALTAHLSDDDLTPVQRAFHTAGRMHPSVAAYGYVRQTIAGPLDTDRLRRALAALVARHPMLRMRLVGPEPRRVIDPPSTADTWFTERPLTTTVAHLEEELSNRPIDLANEPPLRAVLARETPDVAHLVLVGHHAAVDGHSLHQLCQELWTTYRDGPDRTRESPFPTLPSTPATAADLAYWRTELATHPNDLRLPYDGDPAAAPAPPIVTHQVTTDAGAVRAAAAAIGVSPFHLVLSSYLRCLATWTGQRRIAVNVARSGRHARVPGIESLVGPLADVLPVAVDVGPATGLDALARQVRRAWLESERHGSPSGVDIGRLASAVGGRPPPVGFSFAHFPVTVDAAGLPTVTATAAGTGSAATRLSLLAWELDGVLHLSWNFPLALFRRETVARLAAEHLDTLQVKKKSIVARILDRCAATPHAIAVDTFTGERITYADLDRASARLAGALLTRSPAGAPVGLLTAPGVDTVVGVLGIMRAGAAYVPLDATHPAGRLRDQLDRCGAGLVVCHAPTAGAAAAIGVDRLDLADAEGSTVDAEPADVAYIMFTSGSTGRPKGVPITHAALATYLDWAVDTFGYGPGDRMLQPAPICFDASVRQILAPLLAGATVVPVGRDLLLDPEALLGLVERARITVWSSVPSLWERLLGVATTRGHGPALPALRWVHVGGEPLRAEPVRRWFDHVGAEARVTNLYGPTETTINATYHVVDARPDDDAGTIPIGRPAADAELAIVDERGEPADEGELLIAGPGLTPGYLDDPPENAFRWRAGRRWYASGDLVRRLPDGTLEFVGRRDDQIKVRGHRVEPGEAEAALRGHPDVERAAVLPGDGRLDAYVQLRAGAGAGVDDLRAHLRGRLPEYLVPARMRLVAELPLTAAGKLDRSRLPDLREGSRDEGAGAARGDALTGGPPRGATEEAVAAAWANVLGVEEIGRDEDFFALGGDSILALDMFARLGAAFPALPRPTVIYRNRTVRALAAQIAAEQGKAPAPVRDGAAETGPFAVTPAQLGFLLAEALDPAGDHGWLARVRLRGPLDRERFQRAVDAIVERHGMLRTVFPAGARPPVQQELPAALRLPVAYETGPVEAVVLDERSRRFEPWAWPLIRLRLVRVAADEHVLVVHAHHLIGDGYSAAVLSRELVERYRDPDHRPPPLRSTFRDYVAVAGAGPTLRPRMAAGRSGSARSTVDPGAAGRLRELAARHGSTVHAAVLAAYVRVLRRHTGRHDLVVGIATTGREHALPDIHLLFGPCVSAITVAPPAGGSFDTDLGHVVDSVAAARDATPTGEVDAFFTYLDFGSLAPEPGELAVEWDPDSELEPPAAGAEFFLAARPAADGLRLTVRAALPADRLRALADEICQDLVAAVRVGRKKSWSGRLDAALVGYLPSPAHLASLAGLPTGAVPRDRIRQALFPDGGPRLLEVAETRLGRSGYVCLPLFADELSDVNGLAAEVARAVDVADVGSVSLAGMLPSLTGYGFALAADDRVTTGHAATAVAVAGTVLAALDAAGRAADTIAFLGVGSIGRATLDLVLDLLPTGPRRIILSDLPGTLGVREDLCRRLRSAGHSASPGNWNEADLVVAATSATTDLIGVESLRPGTIVVDDSFPPAIDPVAALGRMRRSRDVLVAGGGLLSVGPVRRITAPDLPPDVVERYAAQPRVPGTLASCQVESLARAADPDLPIVRGLVEPAVAHRYRKALSALGIGAAPLHLMHEVLDLQDARRGSAGGGPQP